MVKLQFPKWIIPQKYVVDPNDDSRRTWDWNIDTHLGL